MARKKILFLTYYWPPAGGAGVQRWLKMVKYLSKEYDITVYHPQNAEYSIVDSTLKKDIPDNIQSISHKIWEPYKIAEKISGKNSTYKKGQIDAKENQSVLSKLSLWVRANFFIPDARMFWIKPSINYLTNYLKNNPQDVIISTGPPHSVHLIALGLKQKNDNITWLADFRDPWTEIDYAEKLPLTKRSKLKNEKLEKEVLIHADAVTTVSPSWAKSLEKIRQKKVNVVYNGFDVEDFKKSVPMDNSFTFTYVGSLNDDRNPPLLWESLNEILQENKEYKANFKLQLIGTISPQVIKEILSYSALSDKTEFIDYMPHEQAIQTLQKSHVLLLLINDTQNQKGIIPGKFFEYLAAQRKILCLGSKDSDLATILYQVKAGEVVEREDKQNIKSVLNNWFSNGQNKNWFKTSAENIEYYSRKNAAEQISRIIQNK